MRILTIIVSYNFERWIDRCLGSLRLSSHPTDTVVIDNGSKDSTVELVRERFPEVRLIPTGKNLGFGRANNIGMKIALDEGYDAVFLLNQDAWIDSETIGTLARLSEKNQDYGILSPIHLNGAADWFDKGFAAYAHIPNGQSVEAFQSAHAAEILITAPFVNAAFWFIPRRVLEKVGGFCPLFYHYGEDVDYVNRLHHFSLKVGYCPQVSGCHDREFREVTRAAWLRSESVYALSEYSNVKYSAFTAFGYGVVAFLWKSLKALFKLRPQDAASYAGIAFRLIGRSAEVARYRKQNKRGGRLYI